MEKIFLRAINMEDLEIVHKWHSDRDLYTSLVGPFKYVSKDAEREWLENKVKYSNQEINLMICLSNTAVPIGMISVREIDWMVRKGHLTGIFIGDPTQRMLGYGEIALTLMLKHCFGDLGLNRIWTHILVEHEISLRLFNKCGFKVEGQLRDHAFKEGCYRDVFLVGLCADDYFAKRTDAF